MNSVTIVLLAFVALAASAPSFMLNRNSHPSPSPACFSCRSVVSAARLHKERVSIAICDRLASWQREECVKTVNNFGAKLSFLTIKHEMSSEVVCEHMGVCGGVQVAEAAVAVAPVAEEDVLVPFGQIKCQICEDVVGWAEKQLNATNSNITSVLMHICDPLPSFLEGVCDSFVQAYGPLLVPFINGEFPPAVACNKIGVCKNSTTTTNHHISMFIEPPHAMGAITCEICEEVVEWAEKFIGSTNTTNQIVTFLQQYCKVLGPFDNVCEDFIAKFGAALAPFLEEHLPPTAACASVSACPSNTTTTNKVVVLQSNSTTQPNSTSAVCSICEFIIKLIEKENVNVTNVQAVENFIESKVCTNLPSTYQFICNATTTMYGNKIAAAVSNNLPPQQACASIGACPSMAVVSKPELLIKLVPVVVSKPELLVKLTPQSTSSSRASGAECLACRLVVNAAEEELANSNNEAVVEQFLNKTVCNTVVPQILRPECASLINSYLPELVAKVLAGHNATQICTDISACAKSSAPAVLLLPAKH